MKRLFLFAPAAATALLLISVLVAEGDEQERGFSVSTLARTVTLACLVASVLGGVIPKRADVRLHAAVTLAIFGATAIGQSRMTPAPAIVYRVGCLMLALVVIVTLRAPHRWARMAAERGRPRSAVRRGVLESLDKRSIAVLAIVWVAVTVLFATQLPRASRAVERRVARYFAGYEAESDSVGFSSKLELGSMRGMLQSNKVVLRIDGAAVDYLRGAVLDDYDAPHQRWSSTLDNARSDVAAQTPRTEAFTRIRVARSAPVPRGDDARWFLPAQTCDLRTESGHIEIDRGGIAHPAPPTLASEISFRSGPGCVEAAVQAGAQRPAAPSDVDAALSRRMRASLDPIAVRWTQGLTTDRAKLDAIARELGRFGYSLDVKRDPRVPAVVDLLVTHREGHCELFATAMALLGRTQGIHTRIVTGYRVAEQNPITGLSIVRERNAHAWVEAWVDGRWDAWDPTPAVERSARASASGWEDAAEVLAWLGDRAIATLWELGLAGSGFGAAALAGVLLVVRRVMQRGKKLALGDVSITARPLPAFERLANALERAGWVRASSEPLERFARRIDVGGEPWSEDVARALVGYAELRYGGVGEDAAVARRLDDLARTIRPVP